MTEFYVCNRSESRSFVANFLMLFTSALIETITRKQFLIRLLIELIKSYDKK